MSETFIKIDLYCNTLKFQDKPSLRTGQKSVLQHSLLLRYAYFSKLLPIIHNLMASTFQCEYCQCFRFKICNKIYTNVSPHKGHYILKYE